MKWNSKAAESRGGERSEGKALISHTGQTLDRSVSFKFALDPNQSQVRELFSYAGARRYAWNHHVERVKANLERRASELDAGKTRDQLTPSLSWSAQSLINHFNAWKNGKTEDYPVNEDGTRGLRWRDQVSADVFECASVAVAREGTGSEPEEDPHQKGVRTATKHQPTPLLGRRQGQGKPVCHMKAR